jgi:DNA invertase Pin-like site-specific DNA recombinase
VRTDLGRQASGRLARRPEWDKCFEHLRRGDELVITRLSRPFRSVRHMTELAAQLDERGIDLIVVEQGIDTTTPAGRFLFHVIAAMDEMTADLISEGSLEGLESARARGRTGGRPPALTELQVSKAREMYEERDGQGKRKIHAHSDRRDIQRLSQDDLPPPRSGQTHRLINDSAHQLVRQSLPSRRPHDTILTASTVRPDWRLVTDPYRHPWAGVTRR